VLARSFLVLVTLAIAAAGWLIPRPTESPWIVLVLALLGVAAGLQLYLAWRDERAAGKRRYVGRIRR
jgi:F0F1-type ATP synthase assembly protein I